MTYDVDGVKEPPVEDGRCEGNGGYDDSVLTWRDHVPQC